MLWCLKDWAVETGKRFDSPLSSHSLLSQNNGQAKNRNTAHHGQYLSNPLPAPLPRLQCPELYLARTKPLCHLFKGPFFLFLSLFFAHGLGILYYCLLPLYVLHTHSSSVRMVSSRRPMNWASSAQLTLQLSSSVGCSTIFILTTLILFLSLQRNVQVTMLSSTSTAPPTFTILYKDISGLVDYPFCCCQHLLKHLPSARWREGYPWSTRFLGECEYKARRYRRW